MTGSNDNLEFRLSQFFDGQLDDPAARELQEQVQKDPALAEELRQMGSLDNMLHGLARESDDVLAKVDFDTQRHQIMAGLERKALLTPMAAPRYIRLVFTGLAAAAAVVALALGAILVFRSQAPAPQGQVAAVVANVHKAAPAAGDTAVVASAVVPVSAAPPQGVVTCHYARVSDEQLPLAALNTLSTPAEAAAPTGRVDLPPGVVMVFGAGKPAPTPAANANDIYAF